MTSLENYIQPECRVITIAARKVICNSGEVPDYNNREDLNPLEFNWL